jgi:DNA-binding NarL/FixJ family response regulator
VRHVLEGTIYLSESASERLKQRFVGVPKAGQATQEPAAGSEPDKLLPAELLSDREFEVFCLIGQGIRVGLIAERLFLSVKTVETYQKQIKEKLDLPSAEALSKYAVAWVKTNMAQ